MTQALYNVNGTIYVELFGEFHGIPDPGTLTAVFGPNPIVNVDNPPYPQGFVISRGSFLFRHSNGTVYLITNNKKYGIVSQAALNHYQFRGVIYPRAGGERNACNFIGNLFANALPDGQVIDI